MRDLNAIAEENAREVVDWGRDLLAELLADDRGRGAAFHESVGGLALRLALLSYALEEDEEAVERLRLAAEHLAPALALREPPEPDEHRGPWRAEQWIDVVACWGDADAVATVAGLRPWRYRNPIHPEHDALAAYLGVLLRRLGGGPVDSAALAAVVRACDAGVATKEDRLFLQPAAAGLLAVDSGDADGWNYALARILSAHSQEARRGDLRLLPDGCLSFRALLLAKLGLDRGLKLRARSIYMPVEFLEDGGAA